jgi:hypothetical protein
VLFIPGVYSGPINYLFNTYFKPQFDYLNQKGIKYYLSQGNSEKKMLYNAKCLREQILDSSQDLTIITHSKGGIDLIETIRIYPEVKEKIQKIHFLQAPLYGSPVADLLTSTLWGRMFLSFSLTILRGDRDCIHEITTEQRAKYMSEVFNKEILHDLDVNFVAAHKDPDAKMIDSCLFLFRNWMYKNGIKSDGLVPLESAYHEDLPKTLISDLDHASAVVVRTPLKIDIEEFNKMLFAHL